MSSKKKRQAVVVDESVPMPSGESVSTQSAQPAEETEQAEACLVAVRFVNGFNPNTKEPQVKGSFRAVQEGGDILFVSVVTTIDAENKPKDGEIWVVEARKKPIAKWNHKNVDNSVTPSILVSALPLMQIEMPTEIRFTDRSPNSSPCSLVQQALPDGTKVAFVADRKGTQPRQNEMWKVKASHVVQHDMGEGKTVVIAVECLSQVTAKPMLKLSEAFASAKVWRPGQKAQLNVA